MHAVRALCLCCVAATTPLLQAEHATTLQIQPGLCVIEQDSDLCETDLRASWQHPSTTEPLWCLHEAEQTDALYCEAERQDSAQYFRWQARLQGSTWYRLKPQHSDNTIASAQVKVARLVTDVRPRRRHGWGIL